MLRKEILVVSPESSLEEVARICNQSKIQAVLVVSQDKRLLGGSLNRTKELQKLFSP